MGFEMPGLSIFPAFFLSSSETDRFENNCIEPSREVENYMEMCLGLFYAPSRSIPEEVRTENSFYFKLPANILMYCLVTVFKSTKNKKLDLKNFISITFR